MPSKRINPEVPGGQVSMTVSESLPLANAQLLDPNVRRFDTTALAKGLEYFSQKAAERKQDMKSEAVLKGREFVRNNPEVFSAAADDESLERALRGAVKDGAVPRALLPSFQEGVRKSIAEDRLKEASSKVSEAVLGYSGIDEETGYPKDLTTVQREIGALVDGIIGEIPEFLRTDPAFGERVGDLINQMEAGAAQDAFNKALSDRTDWASKNAQEVFQEHLDRIDGPLSSVEEDGLSAVLDGLVTRFKRRGVEDVETALVDAAINVAKRLRGQDEEDALYFLESVGKFKVNGQAVGLNSDFTSYTEAVRDAADKGDSRKVVRQRKKLQEIQAAIEEARGDLSGYSEDGDYEGLEAGIRQAISEIPIDPELDGRVELLIQDTISRAKAQPNEDLQNEITLMSKGLKAVPEDWIDVYGSRVNGDQFAAIADAFAKQQQTQYNAESEAFDLDRRVQSARRSLDTSGMSNTVKIHATQRLDDFEFRMREALAEYEMSLVDEGLSPVEISKAVREKRDGEIQAFETNVEKLLVEMSNMDGQISSVTESIEVPTISGISEAQKALGSLRGKVDRSEFIRLQKQIDDAKAQVFVATQGLRQSSDNPAYQDILDQTSVLVGEDGNADPAISKAVESVFTRANEDPDAFIERVYKKYGFVTEQSVSQELSDMVTDQINSGEGGSLSDVVQRDLAYREFYGKIKSTWTAGGAADVFLKSQEELGKEAFHQGRLLNDRPTSFDVDRVFKDGNAAPEEKTILAAAFFATPRDVINGSVTVNGTDGWSQSFPLDGIDWRSTPMGNSLKGIVQSIPSDIDDRGGFLQQIGYLPEGAFLEEDVYAATSKFLKDQEVLVKIRR